MSDPATTSTLPVTQQLDPWKEQAENSPEHDDKPEVAEAIFEIFFDQSDVVADQATEYWQEHVLKREFESDEQIFVFNNRTHQERALIVENLEKEEDEWSEKIGQSQESDEQQKIKQKVVAIRELRSQVIMEQAWSDVSYLHAHRAKIESETRDLALNAQDQNDVENLKKIAEKASHLADRLTKFGLYAESAMNLFKKYREVAPDIADFTKGYQVSLDYGDMVPGLADVTDAEPTQRYASVMHQLLISVEKSTGHSFETGSQGDRDYLTTFDEMRDTVLGIDYKRFVVLIAARVRQLESELPSARHDEATSLDVATSSESATTEVDENAQPEQSKSTSNPGELVSALGLSFDDILNNHQEAIADQTQKLDDPNQSGTPDADEGTDGVAVTQIHKSEDQELEKKDRENTRKAAIIREMNDIFKGNKATTTQHAT